MTAPIPYHHPPPQGPWAVDLGHLKTLAICHYVWGGLTIVLASVFIFHIVLGVVMLRGGFPMPVAPAGPGTAPPPPMPPPAFVGWMLVGMGSLAVLFGWTVGVLTIVSGRCLARRRSRVFSLVMAGFNCLSVPIGTVLGVFTFIVLFRPSVQALYDAGQGAEGGTSRGGGDLAAGAAAAGAGPFAPPVPAQPPPPWPMPPPPPPGPG